MLLEIETLASDGKMNDARKILKDKHISVLLVVGNDKIIGITSIENFTKWIISGGSA